MDITQYLDPDIIGKLQAGGYILMLWLMILEWPLITLASAFLASMGFFDIYIVALLGWIGDLLGDMIFFSIGRFGMQIFKKKTTIDTPTEKTFIQKLDTLIHKNLILALFIIKFTPYAPPIGLTYIGRSHISMRQYIIASLITCTPIPLAAAMVGFHVGYISALLQRYPIEKILPYVGLWLIITILLIVLLWFIKKKTDATIGKDHHIDPYPNEKNTMPER